MDYIDKAYETYIQSLSRALMASLQVIFSLAIFFFVNPTFVTPSLVEQKQLQKAGKVIEDQGKVFVQRGQDPNWWPIKDGDTIYVGDRLFASEGSQLGISLSDGRKAWVRPDSLLSIHLVNDEEKLILERGELYVNFVSGQRLLMVNGDIILANEPAQLLMQNLGGEQDYEVKYGSVSLYNRDRQLEQQLFQRKTVEQMQKDLKLVSPFGTLYTRVNHDSSEVEFQWEWAGDPMLWAVEVSSDPSFAIVDYRTDGYITDSNTIHKLPPGNWYWRIKARRMYSQKIYESAGLEFTIIVPQPMRTLTSSPIQIAQKKKKAKRRRLLPAPNNIRFSPNTDDYTRVDWNYPHATNRFYWQISCKDNFKTRDLNAYTGQSFFIMQMQEYYNCLFRVRSYSKKSLSYWSRPVPLGNYVSQND